MFRHRAVEDRTLTFPGSAGPMVDNHAPFIGPCIDGVLMQRAPRRSGKVDVIL